MAATYGVSALLANAYHDDDKETFDLIFKSVDAGTVVASTFQLVYTLLHTIPGGRLKVGAGGFDIREEAFDHFANRLSEGADKAAAFAHADSIYIVTATTTIVMGSIQPLLDGGDPESVNIEQEGLDERGFMVVIASIAEAALESFRAYIGLTDILPDLGTETTYTQASERLLSLIPKITYKLERGDKDI